MSKDIYSKVIEELRDELIGKTGDLKPSVKALINSLINNKAEEYKLYKIKPTAEEREKEARALLSLVVESITNSRVYERALYKNQYSKLKALVDEGKTFAEIFTQIHEDESYLNDVFIQIIEEKEGVAITSAKQLQKLSGITEIWEQIISNKKEAQKEAEKQIEDTFIKGMSNRYSTTIEDMLEAGAKYKDITLLNPKDFNLPDQWTGTLAKNKEDVILWAISFTYLINEPQALITLPNLRAVAEEIEAPYSVLMNCHKLFNK